MTQHVEVLQDYHDAPGARWQPAVGVETTRLLGESSLPDDARDRIRIQSVDVLSRCVPPSERDVSTGLVVGYVQSGKTLSFTTVIALARDNNIPLVILLAGTKRNLHAQTSERLSRDLKVERPGGLSPWAKLEDPAVDKAGQVAQYIKQMTGTGVPEKFRRTTVITVMKNPVQLGKVRALLEALPQHDVELSDVPVLIVDDEADQAGLNAAVAADDTTATYQSIINLRGALPWHTYLMYTATPQAPLLINLVDTLSPDFVRVLEAGAGYTGGRYFFVDNKERFVRRLSHQAVDEALSSSIDEPPVELKSALASFFIALAQRGGAETVSMLVHPSHTVSLQQTYGGFVHALRTAWLTLLQDGGPDRDALVDEWLQPAYDDLVGGGDELRPFEDLLGEMPFWLGDTQVRVVNAETPADSDISWNASSGWVLVGGNKLDRGFTVEGLTTTYMPRRIGGGQVDTVQQRARFFGYKASYGALCRAWLSGPTAEAFERYVEHEERLRGELQTVAAEGKNLKDWKRQMLLDPAYKPTRRAVIDLPYFHDRIRGDAWVSLGRLPAAGASNRGLVQQVVDKHASGFEVVTADPRDDRKHRRALVPMSEVVAMLADWRCQPDDQVLVNQAALLLTARLDADEGLTADVYLMDGFAERLRSPSEQTGLLTFQQGRSPNGPYPGDAHFFTDGVTAVQLHNVRVKGTDTTLVGLSIRVPAALAGGVLVQA